MLACWIPLDSDLVALLSVRFCRALFIPMEAKCILGVAVCRFSGVLLILAFKRRFRVVFLAYTVSDKFALTGKFIIRTYPPNLSSSACTVIST